MPTKKPRRTKRPAPQQNPTAPAATYICATCGWTGTPRRSDRWLKIVAVPVVLCIALILPALGKMYSLRNDSRVRMEKEIADQKAFAQQITQRAHSPQEAERILRAAATDQTARETEQAQRERTATILWSVILALLVAGAVGALFVGTKKAKADVQCAECNERKIFPTDSTAGKRLAARFGKAAA